MPAAEALAGAGLEPVVLRAKEGLALINGTDGILGMLVLAITDLEALARLADVTAAMTVEACSAPTAPSPPTCRRCGRRSARRSSAANLRRLLAGSAIVASHREGDPRVQDAYSLRCTPQVHGAALDTIAHARTIAERELDAAIDNPMILPDGRVESCGNFHGAPLGFVCDFLAIAVSRALGDRRASHRPAARRHPLARPAAVPRTRPGRQLGADDRPLHAGRDGDREQASRRAGQRRLAADERDAGGPRVDGVGGGAQAAPRRSTTCAGCSPSSSCARRVRSTCGRRSNRPPARAPPSPRCAGGSPGAGPDRWLSPELGAAEDLLRSGAVLDAVESAIGPLDVV